MKKKLAFLSLVVIALVAIAAVVQQSTSQRVLYASQMGCVLNSDPYVGGGTDDSAALQAALNLASTKGYKLIVDGPALVSTNLVIPSNTRLEFLPGAGLFLRPGSDTWLIGNAQNTNYASTNIVIQGGILNHNGNFQKEYVTNGFRLNGAQGTHGAWFAGVDGLILRDVTMRSAKAYSFLFNDCRNVTVENCASFYTNNVALTNTLYGNDGMHLYCNISNFRANGFWAHGNQDDVVALMTDETDFTLPFLDPRWTTNSGSMSNIVIENVFLDNVKNVGKIQSYGSPNIGVRRVYLRNFYGKSNLQGFVTVLDSNLTLIPSDVFVMDGFDVEFGSGFDGFTTPAIHLSLLANELQLSNVRIIDRAGAGIGTEGLITISGGATNILLNNLYIEGSANSVANSDTAVSILSYGVTNQPLVSMNNVTVRSLAGVVDCQSSQTGPTPAMGIFKLSNINFTPGTVVNMGGFTNFSVMPTNLPTNGQVITATGTAGETAWGTPTAIGGWTYYTNVIGNETTTGQSLVDITNLVFTAASDSMYEFEALLYVQTSASSAGVQYGIANTGAGSGLTCVYMATGYTNSAGVGPAAIYTVITTNGTTPAFLQGISQTGVVILRGVFNTQGGTPTIAIRHLKVTSGTSTILRGSNFKVKKVF